MDEDEYKMQKYLDEQNWDEEDRQHYDKIEKEVKNQMGTIREEAQAYEPKQTLNIADLDKVELDKFSLQDGEGESKDGKTFTYKFFVLDAKEYRVPGTVLEEIQKMLKLKPELKFVKVIKTGSGQYNTKYTVEEYKEVIEEKVV